MNIVKTSDESLIQLENKKRWGLFLIHFFEGILSSCDGGIIPQATKEMTKNFKLENQKKKIGLYGWIDYIGRVFGALFFTFTINKISRKILLISTLIFKALTLYYSLIDNTKFYPNLIVRCLSGISQVFYTTYLPVWTDQFIHKEKRAFSFLQSIRKSFRNYFRIWDFYFNKT